MDAEKKCSGPWPAWQTRTLMPAPVAVSRAMPSHDGGRFRRKALGVKRFSDDLHVGIEFESLKGGPMSPDGQLENPARYGADLANLAR
jgi:hypothetical protein